VLHAPSGRGIGLGRAQASLEGIYGYDDFHISATLYAYKDRKKIDNSQLLFIEHCSIILNCFQNLTLVENSTVKGRI
jgi:hypothetical protein